MASTKEQAMKKEKFLYAKDTSEYWGTIAKAKALAIKTYFQNGEHHLKGKWVDTEKEFDLPLIFFSELPGADVITYKGYKIVTTPNGTHQTSLIYKGKKEIGGTFSGPLDEHNSVYKATEKIDGYLS